MPNARGGRTNRGRVAGVLAKASARASEQPLGKGLPPLPNTTPHTLRRTYISIALVANSFDVKWVMAQVGHSDSRMTMDVYAQLEQRVKREHGESFDRLVRQAGETQASRCSLRRREWPRAICGTRIAPSRPRANGSSSAKRHRKGTGTRNRGVRGPIFHPRPMRLEPSAHGRSELNGETGTRTRDTTIFSRVLYQLSYLAACAARGPLVDAIGCAPIEEAHRRPVPTLRGRAAGRSGARRGLPAADPHLEVQVRARSRRRVCPA